ncbi:MAG TPA: cytochrome-c peroxidase [Polyangiaceae bacterium]|nr:cytochrome-c peroxidase [Polyangiaceae bacterium]
MGVRRGWPVCFGDSGVHRGFALVAAVASSVAVAYGCSVEPGTPTAPAVGGGTSSVPPGTSGSGNADLPNGGSGSGGGGFGGTGGSVLDGGPPTLVAVTTPFQPTFGALVTAAVAPPPISGGTLLVTQDGKTAVAADSDRDAVYLVDLGSMTLTSTLSLKAGDEPGRLVEDGAGRVHVALRGGAALVTIDVAGGSISARRPTCPAPRGVAWDSSADLVWVACATGELVGLPSSGGAATRTLVLERDLRDIVAPGDGTLSITKFRSAEVLRVAADGTVTRRDQLPSPTANFSPHVAWRTLPGLAGSLVAVHQAESTTSLSTMVQGGYGSPGCGATFGPVPPPPPPSPPAPAPLPPPIDTDAAITDTDASLAEGDASPPAPTFTVDASGTFPSFPSGCLGPESGAVLGCLTVLAPDGSTKVSRQFAGALPVDVAVSRDGNSVVAVAAGNSFVAKLNNVFYFTQQGTNAGWSSMPSATGPAIAVAFDANGDVLVQTRDPATLTKLSSTNGSVVNSLSLSGMSRGDSGHDIFHAQAGGGIACASCHPEGGDDGHVWILDGKHRRTPSLRGTIAGTAPYHWPGDEADLTVLVNDVYTRRMSGTALTQPQMSAIQGWVQKVPAPPAPTWVDASAAKRGQAIFNRADVGCATCHSGPKFTNNATVDVQTGGAFQVPPLVGVGWRTPLLHDGCATTIADRFGACATPTHGSIGSLSQADISDLTAYLETL